MRRDRGETLEELWWGPSLVSLWPEAMRLFRSRAGSTRPLIPTRPPLRMRRKPDHDPNGDRCGWTSGRMMVEEWVMSEWERAFNLQMNDCRARDKRSCCRLVGQAPSKETAMEAERGSWLLERAAAAQRRHSWPGVVGASGCQAPHHEQRSVPYGITHWRGLGLFPWWLSGELRPGMAKDGRLGGHPIGELKRRHVHVCHNAKAHVGLDALAWKCSTRRGSVVERFWGGKQFAAIDSKCMLIYGDQLIGAREELRPSPESTAQERTRERFNKVRGNPRTCSFKGDDQTHDWICLELVRWNHHCRFADSRRKCCCGSRNLNVSWAFSHHDHFSSRGIEVFTEIKHQSSLRCDALWKQKGAKENTLEFFSLFIK